MAIADDSDNLNEVLRQTVESHLAAFNQEDVSASMQYVHPKSPEYVETSEVLSTQFSALDPNTELTDFRYLGHDDEFAVARLKLKTTEESDEPFAANIIDAIAVFHQEDGMWKLWSDHILGVELVE